MTENLFSDEDESILTENDKNGISDVLNTIDCASSLDILQDDVLDDVINDSNDVMDISIHGNFSNHQNVNSKISGPDSLTSLMDPEGTESVLALAYKETREVSNQTSFPVKSLTEVATQVNLGSTKK